MKIISSFLVSLCLCGIQTAFSQTQKKELYLNEDAPIHNRTMDLLSKLSIEDKVSLLRATSPEIPGLEIGKYYHGNEALHGVVRPGNFTVFPQAIGLASMWNPELHYEIATAISDEARGRWNELEQGKKQTAQFSDLLTFWSPTVNMARDPRWGRTPETYGEDPFLSGTLGAQFVKGLQGNHSKYLKVVATPKHFAGNNEEHNRFECDMRTSEKNLREYYLPAFEQCVKEGKAASIMTAYNAINGVPCTVNNWLLQKVLREEWGFDGYVVSDCGAPALLVSHHKYIKTKEVAAMLSIKAGLDLECGDNVYMQPLLNAYWQRMVSDEDINTAAYRVLRARMKLGLFDNPQNNPYNKISPEIVGSEKHKGLALEAARQSIVLLKNKNNTLPIDMKKIKSIAVVGINAANCEFGDYSGFPVNQPVSVLQGIKDKVGDQVKIVHAPWVSALDGYEMITAGYFPEGLRAEYFSNRHLEGEPKVRTDEWINYEPANQAPDPFLPKSPISIRWKGKLRPTVSGNYTFAFSSDDGCRLMINGKRVIDSWHNRAVSTDTFSMDLEAGKDYEIQAEYFDDRDAAVAKLAWKIPVVDKKDRLALYGNAGKAVRECEMTIAVLGINKSIEREGQDRQDIALPKDQEEFIREIYKVNPNTVVVLVAGSSLAINWIDENIPAILNAWYPGEQGGTAVAEVLFGDYNPGGRLPLTYYNDLNEIPPFDDYDITKGRTYMYFNKKTLYPFGYGLSYSSFSYENMSVKDNGGDLEVSFDVKNTGKMNGDEVAQLYVKLPDTNRPIPIKQLKGFKRIHVKAGKAERVEIKVEKENLRVWDEKKEAFVTPAGKYVFMIGSSSADIRLNKEVEID